MITIISNRWYLPCPHSTSQSPTESSFLFITTYYHVFNAWHPSASSWDSKPLMSVDVSGASDDCRPELTRDSGVVTESRSWFICCLQRPEPAWRGWEHNGGAQGLLGTFTFPIIPSTYKHNSIICYKTKYIIISTKGGGRLVNNDYVGGRGDSGLRCERTSHTH